MNLPQIKKRISSIEANKEEIRKIQEIIKDQMEQNPQYQEAIEKAKEIAVIKRKVKQDILSKPENEKFIFEIKELQEENKTSSQILSAELVEYYQKNNTDEIEDNEGNKRKFSFNVKISNPKDY